MPKPFVTFSLLAALLPGQAPAPAGETAAAFTASEAQAFAMAAGMAKAWRDGLDLRHAQLVTPPGDYRVRFARAEGDGTWCWVGDGEDPARVVSGGPVLAYLLPTANSAARRLFCVRGDGVFAWSDNRVGLLEEGDHTSPPDGALADGGKGTLRDFPRAPARGRDGNEWLPSAMVRQVPVRVTVVDEDDAPMGGVWVETFVAAAANGIDAELPAGGATTLFEGDTGWSGAPARGLGLAARLGHDRLPVTRDAVTVEGRSVRIRVTRRELRRLGLTRNESAAIATLKNISSAQSQCQASGVIDVNQNGAGEYGTFAELAGRVGVRGTATKINPPVLSSAFGNVANGIVTRSGYHFRMLLPGKDGVPVPELPAGGADAAKLDALQAEVNWCAYAWPVEPGVTGSRTFFIDQSGDVLACDDADGRYAGAGKPPEPGAARRADSKGLMNDHCAGNRAGRDGKDWIVVD